MCIGSMGMEYGAGGSQMVTYISGGDETCMFGSSREMEALAEAIVVARLVSFFFFQAEDGIRDGRVTGVQTCALPIWAEKKQILDEFVELAGFHRKHAIRVLRSERRLKVTPPVVATRLYDEAVVTALTRSEERRVGKECSYGWMRGV